MVAPTQMTATGLKVSHVVADLKEKQSSLAAVGGMFGPITAALGGAADARKGEGVQGAARGAMGSMGGAMTGAITGAVIGAALSGGREAATGAGALLGAHGGSALGAHLLSKKTREGTKKSSADVVANLLARG